MKKPFIKLFKTPNSKYFLVVNKNEFVEVSDESYDYLSYILENEDSLDNLKQMPNELLEIQSMGYLSVESAVREVRHAYTDVLDVFLSRKMSKITLQLTQDCNLRCKYCVYSDEDNVRQRSHSRKRMDWETAKKAVDFLWEHSVDSINVNIGFYGGEPLLEFPLIKQVVKYSHELFIGKILSLSITTNITLLTDDMIRFFDEHEVSLLVSLDGPKEIHDKNRVFVNGEGTFDSVIERIQRIKELAPKLFKRLQVSMVIDPSDDFDCFNSMIIEGAELEKSNIFGTIVDLEYDDKVAIASDDYIVQYEYQRFLALLSIFGRFPKSEVSAITAFALQKFMGEIPTIASGVALNRIDVPSGTCIPGQMKLFVNAYGNFFPCERVSEASPAMIIGNLDEGFNLHNANQILNIGNLTQEECVSCWCFRYCNLCAKNADSGGDNLSKSKKLMSCESSRASAYSKLRDYLLIKETPIYYPQQIRPLGMEEEGVMA